MLSVPFFLHSDGQWLDSRDALYESSGYESEGQLFQDAEKAPIRYLFFLMKTPAEFLKELPHEDEIPSSYMVMWPQVAPWFGVVSLNSGARESKGGEAISKHYGVDVHGDTNAFVAAIHYGILVMDPRLPEDVRGVVETLIGRGIGQSVAR